MKEHDRTTTKRIQDNRLRVSLLKNTKILIPVHILSQEVSPQLLLVSPVCRAEGRVKHRQSLCHAGGVCEATANRSICINGLIELFAECEYKQSPKASPLAGEVGGVTK